jgi:large subunit ribosomal protein L19
MATQETASSQTSEQQMKNGLARIGLIEKPHFNTSKKAYFRTGDLIKVHVKIQEGDKSRIQVFQGTVIKKSGHGIQETFAVRKITDGIGVERIFPLHSPVVQKIERIGAAKVRRSKLYYIRELVGKKARIAFRDEASPSEADENRLSRAQKKAAKEEAAETAKAAKGKRKTKDSKAAARKEKKRIAKQKKKEKARADAKKPKKSASSEEKSES